MLKLSTFPFSVSLFLICSLSFLSGCVIVDVGRTVQQNVMGEYYLSTKKYSDGQESFGRSLQQNPSDASSHYYLGRLFLAEGKWEKSLPYLKKAVELSPGKADYYFWLGLAQGEAGEGSLEKVNYEKALAVDGNHLQALTYLGHKQLAGKEYEQALASYQKVLKIWPESPSALYNQALAMKKLGRSPEERRAWLAYLDSYPAGPMARRAADNLNALSDFSYRNHTIGARAITLKEIMFLPFSDKLDPASYPSLELLGAVLENMKKGTLQVVFYQKNNLSLAKKRAMSIKDYIRRRSPQLDGRRISLSWFDVPEEVEVFGGILKKDESVRFFLTP